MIRYRILPLALLAAGLVQPAHAQINPFGGYASQPLSGDDLASLGAATDQLLDREHLVQGGVETWHNEKTGASGTITIGPTATRKGYACRVLLYELAPTQAGPRALPRARLTWCKTPDGWKLG